MEKPKYDTIRGLSPTISDRAEVGLEQPALDRRHRHRGARLPARALREHRRAALSEVRQASERSVGAADRGRPARAPARRQGDAPARRSKSSARESTRISSPRSAAAASRVCRVDGKVVKSSEPLTLDKKKKHDVELVIDRVTIDAKERDRLADSVETALKGGKGVLLAVTDRVSSNFSEKTACPACGISFQALAPLAFSFNSPLGFRGDCNGSGRARRWIRTSWFLNPALSIEGRRRGAVGRRARARRGLDRGRRGVGRGHLSHRPPTSPGTSSRSSSVTWSSSARRRASRRGRGYELSRPASHEDDAERGHAATGLPALLLEQAAARRGLARRARAAPS